jgi:hypothetical protein
MSISNYLENLILDKVFNNSDFTITTLYVSLHTGDPGETGANELAGYTRQLGSFSTASGGAILNDTDLTFASLPECTITYTGVWDDVAAGNFLWGGPTTTEKEYGSLDTAIIYAGNLQITLD